MKRALRRPDRHHRTRRHHPPDLRPRNRVIKTVPPHQPQGGQQPRPTVTPSTEKPA